MCLFTTSDPTLSLSSPTERMAKAVVTSQRRFEALLRSIDNEQANVDRHAHLADAERKLTR